MPELFTNISALIVFLIIAAVGFIFLALSLVFGEVFDAASLDMDAHGGLLDGHAFIDSRAISVFVTAFGGFGAIGVQIGLGVLGSSLLGLGSGVVLGGIVSLFARFLYQQQASSSVSAGQLVGRAAQVTVTIPAEGIGQVSCRIGEERVERRARALDHQEIKSGMIVRIEEIAGDSVIVSRETGVLSSMPRAS